MGSMPSSHWSHITRVPGLRVLFFVVVALGCSIVTLENERETRSSRPLKAQGGVGAGGDIVIYVTNIVFDHKPATSVVDPPAESDAIDLNHSEKVKLKHKGSGGAFTAGDAGPSNIGEYIWPCPPVVGGQPQSRTAAPSRNEPALYEDSRLYDSDTRIKVRFQWPNAGSIPKVKKAVITAEFVPPSPSIGVNLPSLVRAPASAGGQPGTHVEFETSGANAGISKSSAGGHGFVDFMPKSGQGSLTGNWKITGGKWKWTAKYVLLDGQAEDPTKEGLGGDPASHDFETTGPHLVYTVLDVPRNDTGWSVMADKDNNPSVYALDFLFDKCGIQGTTTHTSAADKIADYLHREQNGHGLQYDHTYGGPGYTHGWRISDLILPSGAPDRAEFKIVGPSANVSGTLDLEAYIGKSGFGKKPDRAPANSASRDRNLVNCYDCALAVTVLTGLTGSQAKARFMQPFGYINTLYFCGTPAVQSNHPFHKEPMYANIAIAGGDDLDVHKDFNDKLKRSRFANHAFCTIESASTEKVWDCNVGNPGAIRGSDLSSYFSGAIDQSLSDSNLNFNEVRYNLSISTTPPTSWTQPIAGTSSNMTTTANFKVLWRSSPRQ